MSQPETTALNMRLVKTLLVSPREGMREVMTLGLRDAALFQFAALMVVLASMVAYVLSLLAPAPEDAEAIIGPLGYIVVAAANLIITSIILFWGGRMIGGKGDFQDVLLAMSVHQGATIVFQVVFAAAMILFPFLASIVLAAGVFYLIYLMAAYAAEVHGLRSTMAAVGLIVGMIFLLAFILLLLFSLLGIPISGGPGA